MKKIAIAIAAATVVPASPAYAIPLLFDFSGPSGTATFQLDSNPTPDFSQSFIGSDQSDSMMSTARLAASPAKRRRSVSATEYSPA